MLEETLKAIKANRSKGTPIAAVVVAPIHTQSGAVASDAFLSELGKLAQESGAALVIDATETSAGASGKSFWGIKAEHADYLVFGKRSYTEGFYCRP